MYFDSHTHTNFNTYKNDYKEIIDRALKNNVWMIQVGSQKDTSLRAIKIAEEYSEGVYAAVALHPMHLLDMEVDESEEPASGAPRVQFHTRAEVFDKNFYRSLAQSSKKVVAIGECGLEYFRLPLGEEESWKKKQQETLIGHFELARELALPLMIHCRAGKENQTEAYEDILEIAAAFPEILIMMHCYLCPIKDIAKQLLERGAYFSFSGVITFKNAKEMQDIVRYVSSDRVLTETDAPYLTPEPFRGKRNEPLYVKYILKKIAELKEFSEDEMEEKIFQNAKMFFSLET